MAAIISSHPGCRLNPGKAPLSCALYLVALWALLLHGAACAQAGTSAPSKQEASRAQAAGNDEAAIVLYSKALTEDPAWTEGWWKYGGLLYGAHRFQEADAAYAHLTRLAPTNPLGLAMLGMCEYELQDWSDASLHLNKALAHGGLPAGIANSAMYAFGVTLMHQKNRNGALIAFRLLQHSDPGAPNLIPALGSAELGLQQIPPTDGADTHAVQLAGEAAIAVLKLQAGEAERLYVQLLQQYPRLPFAHLCMGLFLQNLGREAEAEQQLKTETEISPATPDAWIWLARLALARRAAGETRAYALHAAQLSPEDGVCFLLSGRSYMLDEQWSKALDDLQKAEALSPDSYEVHHALITVYDQLHDAQGAAAERKQFARTFAMMHSPETDGR